MKVKINGEVFNVMWKYRNPRPEERNPHYKLAINSEFPIITMCIIRKSVPGQESEIVTEAIVKHHSEDPYSKEVAREYSLAKALRITYPLVPVPKRPKGDDGEFLPIGEELQEMITSAEMVNESIKAERRAFWDAYHTRNQKELTEEEMRAEEETILNKLISQDYFIELLAKNEVFVEKLLSKTEAMVVGAS